MVGALPTKSRPINRAGRGAACYILDLILELISESIPATGSRKQFLRLLLSLPVASFGASAEHLDQIPAHAGAQRILLYSARWQAGSLMDHRGPHSGFNYRLLAR
jgi:hypothetical protein